MNIDKLISENYKTNLRVLADYFQRKTHSLEGLAYLRNEDGISKQINIMLGLVVKAEAEIREEKFKNIAGLDQASFSCSLVRKRLENQIFDAQRLENELNGLKERHRKNDCNFELLIDQIHSRFEQSANREEEFDFTRHSKSVLKDFARDIQSNTSDSIERLMIQRMAILETTISPENAMNFSLAKNTLGVLISDYLMKIEQFDLALANSEKHNDHLKNKLEDFMKDLRDKSNAEQLARQRYEQLHKIKQISEELLQEEIHLLRERITDIEELEVKQIYKPIDVEFEKVSRTISAQPSYTNEEIESLKTKISDLETKLKYSEDNSRISEEERSRFKYTSEEYKRRLDEAQKLVDSFIESLNYKKRGFLDGIKLIIEEYTNSNSRLLELSEAQENLESTNKKYKLLYESKKALEEDLEDANLKISDFTSDFKRLRDEKNDMATEVNKVKQQTQDLEKQITSLHGDIRRLESEKEDLNHRIQTLQTRIDFLESAFEINDQNVTGTKTKLSKAELENLKLHLSIKEKDSTITYLSEQVSDLRLKSISNNSSPVKQRDEDYNDTSSEIAHLTAQISSLKDSLSSLQVTNNSTTAKLFKAERDLSGLKNLNIQLHEQLETNGQGLSPQKGAATDFNDLDDEYIAELYQANESLNNHNTELESLLKDANDRILYLEQKITLLEKGLEEIYKLQEDTQAGDANSSECAVIPLEVAHISIVVEDLERDEKERLLIENNSILESKVSELELERNSRSEEFDMLNEQLEIARNIIQRLWEHKNYLIEVIHHLGEKNEIRFGGRNVTNASISDIDEIIHYVLELRKLSPTQGAVYDVIRTKVQGTLSARNTSCIINSNANSVSEEDDIYLRTMNTDDKYLRDEKELHLKEIQELNLRIFDLECNAEHIQENHLKLCSFIADLVLALPLSQSRETIEVLLSRLNEPERCFDTIFELLSMIRTEYILLSNRLAEERSEKKSSERYQMMAESRGKLAVNMMKRVDGLRELLKKEVEDYLKEAESTDPDMWSKDINLMA